MTQIYTVFFRHRFTLIYTVKNKIKNSVNLCKSVSKNYFVNQCQVLYDSAKIAEEGGG